MNVGFELYLYFLLVLTGACIGSFLNVVIYRLPKGEFLAKARSACPACGKELQWFDLIPVVSYIRLRGRCRYCNAKISSRYPIVEAVCAVLAVLCFARFGLDLFVLISFGVSAILLAVALIDHDTMEIPDSLVIAIIPFAVFSVWGWPEVSLTQRFIGFFTISAPMFLLTLIIHEAFGGGDIKLMAVCGFLLGWKNTLFAFFIALLLGGGYAIYLLASGKSRKGEHLAFGPYLCVGIVSAIFFGSEMINFYQALY